MKFDSDINLLKNLAQKLYPDLLYPILPWMELLRKFFMEFSNIINYFFLSPIDSGIQNLLIDGSAFADKYPELHQVSWVILHSEMRYKIITGPFHGLPHFINRAKLVTLNFIIK